MTSDPDIPLDVYSHLKASIRDVPDFPQPGIVFRDITPLLGDAALFRQTLNLLAAPYRATQVDLVIGVESRGFIFGAPLAYLLGVGFVPVRKAGKLPHQTIAAEYALEYGTNVVEAHIDAVQPGQRVVVVDDLLATGGTAAATVQLMEKLGAEIVGVSFVVELAALNGRERLVSFPVHTVLVYP
jgi:adenine phosphoribosyltransferase